MSSATGQTEPTSSMRRRRSSQPTGRGLALRRARTASISLWATDDPYSCDSVLADPSSIVAFIQRYGGKPSDPMEFEFALFQNGFGVIDERLPYRIGVPALTGLSASLPLALLLVAGASGRRL